MTARRHAAQADEETEKLKGGGGATRRRRRHGGQHPARTRRAPARRWRNSNYKRKSEHGENGVDKTVTKTDVAPGAVNKLQVALVVDKSVPAADFAALQDAIKGAAGIDAKRGDVFQAAQVAVRQGARGAEGRPGAGRRCSARSSGSASASRRCSSSSS